MTLKGFISKVLVSFCTTALPGRFRRPIVGLNLDEQTVSVEHIVFELRLFLLALPQWWARLAADHSSPYLSTKPVEEPTLVMWTLHERQLLSHKDDSFLKRSLTEDEDHPNSPLTRSQAPIPIWYRDLRGNGRALSAALGGVGEGSPQASTWLEFLSVLS